MTGFQKTLTATLFIALWFFGHTYRGLFVYFQYDDPNNLYRAWNTSVGMLTVGNLVPVTWVYRPVGTGLYRLLYQFFDFDPMPSRIVYYVFLLVNIWLLYALARRLSGSKEIAVLAALIGAFHRRLLDVYLNNGIIFDVLCYTFTLATLIYYIRQRQREAPFGWRFLALYYLLFTMALNSKEMGVTIPVLLLGYEWIYRRPVDWMRPAVVTRWLLRETWPAWISLAIAGWAIVAKTAPTGPFGGVPDYVPHVNLGQFFRISRMLLAELFFLPQDALNTFKVVVIFVALIVIAWKSKKKYLQFAAVFALVTPLPVDFIIWRGFFVMYLPYAGWAIYTAGLLVEIRDQLWERVWHRPAIPAGWQPERVFLFLFTAGAFFVLQRWDTLRNWDQVDASQAQIKALKEDSLRLNPTLPKGGRVLLASDPFDAGDWVPLMTLQLVYHDKSLVIDRAKKMTEPFTPEQISQYNMVLAWKDGRFEKWTTGSGS